MRTPKEIAKDGRYTMNLELCGYSTPRIVARFCGDYIGDFETKHEAMKACLEHDHNRMKDYL